MFFSLKSVLTLPTASQPSLRFAAAGSIDAAMDCCCANFSAFFASRLFLPPPSSPSRVWPSMPLRPLATRRSPRRAAGGIRTTAGGVATGPFDLMAAARALFSSEDAREATRMGAAVRATVVSDAMEGWGFRAFGRGRARRARRCGRDKVPIEKLG